MNYRHFVLISHLKLHNANAMSSPYTIGFPAMTAWLGAVHSLQRKMQDIGYKDITLDRVAVSCHNFHLQTYKGHGDFVSSIIGTANPLNMDGTRPAFIEEARCHLEVSLLIECLNFKLNPNEKDEFLLQLKEQIMLMKFASGDVLAIKDCTYTKLDEYGDSAKESSNLLRKLMLGYVLIERRDLVKETMVKENKDALESLFDYLKVTHSVSLEKDDKVMWSSKRKEFGWLIPIAVGFQGISELGYAKNQRDNTTQHRFAESIVTLGEFIMPYRKQIDDVLWQYHVDLEKGLYLCRNQNLTNQ